MWYVAQNGTTSIQEKKDALKKQFRKPKSYSQLVADLKDFKQGASELVGEVDQQLKKAIREGGFEDDDRQHTEWFIAMLLPHLCTPMSQQTFES